MSYEKYKRIQLTKAGRQVAILVIRKHRLWEVFLHDKLGFAWDEVHDVAEQLEHIHSEELILRLEKYLILFGKTTYRKMIQNLVWATGYNVVALPLAAGILYKSGILLSPAVGAVLMSVSTVIVAINASLLKVK